MEPFDPASFLAGADKRLAQAFREKVQDAVRDCMKRPLVDKPRVVVLRMEFLPGLHPDTGQADSVYVQPIVTEARLPVMKRAERFHMKVGPDEALEFSPLSPDDARQGILFEGDAEEAANTTRESDER